MGRYLIPATANINWGIPFSEDNKCLENGRSLARLRRFAWLRPEAHHAGLGADDDVNGSERAGRGHGFGLDRRLVTMGGGRSAASSASP